MREIIKKLDSPLAGDQGEVHVYYLKHANAKEMATVLNALSGAIQQNKDKKAGANAPGAAPDVSRTTPLLGGAEFNGKFTITADDTTNALVITAGSKDYDTLVDQVIAKLDIPRRQVYVEAVIVELSVSEEQQLGAGLLGGKKIDIGANQLALFGSTFGFLDPTRLLSGSVGGTNTNASIPINLPSTPGATGSSSSSSITVPAFFSAIQLAQGNTDVNILSTPNILTLDNQEAEIKVGQKVPFPAASATTIGGSLQTTFTREDVALSLKIKPQISEGGTVTMQVTQEDREVLPQQQQPSTASQAGPSTTERSIKTSIVATNGQTIVLGGLIKDQYTNVINKIPLLGDIPILGYLFKVKKRQKQKVNLVVFLTPHIIREPNDFLEILRRKVNEQNAFIDANFGKAQRRQIHQSLETHAQRLLSIKEGSDLENKVITPKTEEEKFPMKPATPPSVVEDSDLAPERQAKEKQPKSNYKKKKGSEVAPPSSSNATPSESTPTSAPTNNDDIDLAY